MSSVAPEDYQYGKLMEMEANWVPYLDGITTVTFFDGPAPLEQLKDRLVKVVQASPWLAGKLVKRKGVKKPEMAFGISPTAEFVLEKLFHEIELDISATMPCGDLLAKVKKDAKGAHIPMGGKLVKQGLPYTRFTVAKQPGSEAGWALIFSISHIVADGFTYYKTLQMMSKDEEITCLTPTRKHSFPPAMKEAVGTKEWSVVNGGGGLMLNYIGNMMFGKKPTVKAFYVDMDKIESAKQKAAGKGTDFVSTNDVLTASWGRMTGARLCEMAVNFRGRLPDLKSDDETLAGNYEGCILFHGPEDFAEPNNIRKALQRDDGKFKTTSTAADGSTPRKLPGVFAMKKCRYRIITNWASFFSHLDFGDGCPQKLHIPFLAPGSMPTDICVIFRPTRDTYGLYIVTRKLTDAALTSADSILGKQVMG